VKRHRKIIVATVAATVLLGVPALAIVGGDVDATNRFPNVCAIIATDHPSVPTPQTVSTGTLIHPKVVMTAAHTVQYILDAIERNDEIKLENYAVVFTVNAHDTGATPYRIDRMYVHDDFTDFDQKAARDATSIDVGLIVLKQAVTGITPVALPTKDLLAGLDLDRGTADQRPQFLIVGYGNSTVPAQGGLPEGIRRIASSGFKSLRDRYLMLSQQFELGEGGLSRGDSGAPALWKLGDGSYVQVGIANNGDHKSVSYGAYVRTDLETVIDFVQGVLDGVGN
jgi:hypothetical protein